MNLKYIPGKNIIDYWTFAVKYLFGMGKKMFIFRKIYT